MGTLIVVLAVAVVVAGVLVTQALERRRAARIAAWSVEYTGDDEDDIIELDERDVWVAPLPPPPPAQALHHHVHHAV